VPPSAKDRLYWANSYERPEALYYAMVEEENHRARLSLFLKHWSSCDAPWIWRSDLANALRLTLMHVSLTECLPEDAREWFDALLEEIEIYRGCQRGRERGLSWTTDFNVALGFAQGKRCINTDPTLVTAVIPKRHVFGVFIRRNESEIAVDPRRLRRLRNLPSYVPPPVPATPLELVP
jgi:hypothetical protein